MPLIKLPLTIEEFQQLPRNAAYRYEYLDGQACLSPRPQHYHALLDLQPLAADESVAVAPIAGNDLLRLTSLFAGAFRYIQPYGSLDDATRRKAARKALERTRSGGDGPLIERASFLARQGTGVVGAMLITLLPDGDPCHWASYHWQEPPPADCIERRLGRPHLTWVFVSPLHRGHGIGTALLSAAVRELLALGFRQLLSTFVIGNDSSMLWHWRNGFRLLAYPGSYRLLKERWGGRAPQPPPA